MKPDAASIRRYWSVAASLFENSGPIPGVNAVDLVGHTTPAIACVDTIPSRPPSASIVTARASPSCR
jgi:hypothetical protein